MNCRERKPTEFGSTENQNDDSVLSEIHATNLPSNSHSSIDSAVRSRFVFDVADDLCAEDSELSEDDEQDTVVVRRMNNNDVIFIDHKLATPLSDVACQVWPGCLLLCDFILDNAKIFNGQNCLELGCGVGLSSILLSYVGANTTATDVNEDALKLLQQNMLSNNHLLRGEIKTELYDWASDVQSDHHPYPTCPIICAADVIYDFEINTLLFRQLEQLASVRQRTIYITTEQRVNFCVETLSESSPMYDQFRDWMVDKEMNCHWTASQILQDDINQYFKYDRNVFIELWKIVTK